MLYDFFEWQKQVLSPFESMANVYAEHLRQSNAQCQPFLSGPLVALTGAAQVYASWLKMLSLSTPTYRRPSFVFNAVERSNGAFVIQEEVTQSNDFCVIRRFWVDAPEAPRTPGDNSNNKVNILILAPISGHYASIFNGCIQCLLQEEGVQSVSITDWLDPREVPLSSGPFGFEENALMVLDFLQTINPDHVIAYSQSVNSALVALALLEDKQYKNLPNTITLIGGPFDTRVNAFMPMSDDKTHAFDARHDEGLACQWGDNMVVDTVPAPHKGQGRKVLPGFVQSMALYASHIDRHLLMQLDYFAHAAAGDKAHLQQVENFYDRFLAVMDVYAEIYYDNLAIVYREHRLPKGALVCAGKTIALSSIAHTAVLCIEADRDSICPTGQTAALLPHLTALPSSSKQAAVIEDCGHLGLIMGHRFHDRVYPVIRDFIRQHSISAPTQTKESTPLVKTPQKSPSKSLSKTTKH